MSETLPSVADDTAGEQQNDVTPEQDALNGMNEEQRAEAVAVRKRVFSRPLRPRIEVEHTDNGLRLVVGGSDEVKASLHSIRLFGALGTRSDSFVDDYLSRLGEAVSLTGDEKRDTDKLSAAVALVAAVDPQNELEATMALQMVAANEAAQFSFGRSRRAEFIEHASAYANMGNKAMRSFALHAEAIAKMRRGGEQVVRHVHVNDGGQAVIAGTVNTGGRNG